MRSIKSLWSRYKELILYVFFGGCTTLINIVIYFMCRQWFVLTVVTADIVAWFLAVVFAYITNKLYVFESKSWVGKVVAKELTEFFAARLFSLGVDVAILYITVEVLEWWELPMKIISNIVVIVINYVFSKWFIFRKDAAKQQKG